jgi:hypothetical protein
MSGLVRVGAAWFRARRRTTRSNGLRRKSDETMEKFVSSGIAHVESTAKVTLSSVTLSERSAKRVTTILDKASGSSRGLKLKLEESSRHSSGEEVRCCTVLMWNGKGEPSS